jgi:citrate synthase
MRVMTAREAAQRMGVKVETLYAYVSRGLLSREVGPDGRSSVFDRREVEALALRGRPRQSSRSTSLSMLIETRLTELTSSGVRYRGHPAADLAVTHTFEEVAELLWLGALPDAHEPWAGDRLALPAGVATVESMSVAVALAGAGAARAPRLTAGWDAAQVAAAGRRLIATAVDALPAAQAGRPPRLTVADRRAVPGTIAGRLWTRLAPRRPGPGMLATLNAALVLLADHDLAASTFGVRVAASTRADPAACVAAGLGVLRGPLHGGASVLARAVLDDASAVGAPRAVGNVLRDRRRVPGFGHKVYTGTDPRATVLLQLLAAAPGGARTVRIVEDVCAETLARTGTAANVDLALAALGLAAGMPVDAGEVIMATARMAGWLAHVIEEYAEAPLRFRPRASYIG